MIRVLQVHAMPLFSKGYYGSVNREALQFDFLTWEGATNLDEAFVESLGATVIKSEYYASDKLRYVLELYKILESGKYDIVHSHASFNNAYTVLAAKLAGTPVRISHSHSAYPPHGVARAILRWISIAIINGLSTDRWACSEEAARCMFGNRPWRLIRNAIDTKKFRFDEFAREECRRSLGLGESMTVCHVGFFGYPKNQTFLLRAFSCLRARRPDAILLLVGDGDAQERAKIESSIAELHLGASVKLLGQRMDVCRIMQAADLFVMPSEFEGLPIALVEAQAAGLACLAADTITREVALTDLVRFLPLAEGPEAWAEAMLKAECPADRRSGAQAVEAGGYELNSEAAKISDCYAEALSRARAHS